METCAKNCSYGCSQGLCDDEHGNDFLGNSLQSSTCANSASHRTALMLLCQSSRNFGVSPTVSA